MTAEHETSFHSVCQNNHGKLTDRLPTPTHYANCIHFDKHCISSIRKHLLATQVWHAKFQLLEPTRAESVKFVKTRTILCSGRWSTGQKAFLNLKHKQVFNQCLPQLSELIGCEQGRILAKCELLIVLSRKAAEKSFKLEHCHSIKNYIRSDTDMSHQPAKLRTSPFCLSSVEIKWQFLLQKYLGRSSISSDPFTTTSQQISICSLLLKHLNHPWQHPIDLQLLLHLSQ